MRCWVCFSDKSELRYSGEHVEGTSSDVKITDANYGKTLPIYECKSCGFQYCPDVTGTAEAYLHLQDEEYEETRLARHKQSLLLLEEVRPFLEPNSSLLDIGAGSGILVEVALQLGFRAVGVEPSIWLSNVAERRGLPVLQGDVTIMYPENWTGN
jgi:hypothetical protein